MPEKSSVVDPTAPVVVNFDSAVETDLPTRVMESNATPGGTRPSAWDHYPFLSPALTPDELGRLGHYRVIRLLGRGGMALVFLAEDLSLGRSVALKVMRPDLASDARSWDRFLREARILASVKHEHLVIVHQVGQENGVIYLAMELLEGETLEQHLSRETRLPESAVLRIGRQIAAGLAVIHQHGLIHRDIKPANLWVERPSERIKLLDFGLARFVEDDAHYTQTGMVVGTPGFMAPEQARGEPVDVRSDLFSLGCVLYALSVGAAPFQAANTMAVLSALALTEPKAPIERNPDVHRALSLLIMRLLRKDAAERPGSAQEVVAELERIESGAADNDPLPHCSPIGRSIISRWRWFAGTALASAAIVGLGYFVSLPRFRSPDPEPAKQGAPDMTNATFLTDMPVIASKDWIKSPPGPPQGKGERGGPMGKGSKDRPGGNDKGEKDRPGPGGKERHVFGEKAVQLLGRVLPKSVFMHPPMGPDGGDTWVTFDVGGRFGKLLTEVTLCDGPLQSDTPLTFVVTGDERELWTSPPIQTQADKMLCEVPIAGVKRLTLEVRCPGASRGAHALWVEPHLR